MSADNAMISLSVESVRVRGSVENIDALNEIRIEIDERPLGLEGIKYERIVMPEGIENVSGETDVEVSFRFTDIGQRVFAVPAENFVIKNLPDNVNITMNTESLNVTFKGLVDALRYFSDDYFDVIVDFESVSFEGSGEYYIPVQINIVKSVTGVYLTGSYSVRVTVAQ